MAASSVSHGLDGVARVEADVVTGPDAGPGQVVGEPVGLARRARDRSPARSPQITAIRSPEHVGGMLEEVRRCSGPWVRN